MDPVTHAASGAVAMLILKNRPATAWAWPIAAIACASPDIDLAFIHTPLEFLELHRGITHSFFGTPFLGFALALCAWPLWRKKTPGHWKFPYVWLFCCAMVLLHIWLDVVTTYGTMVFLPFSHYRVRLNSLFIIDFLVTIPLLWALWRWRFKRKLLALTLLWIFLYPASGIAINAWHTSQWKSRLAEENTSVSRLHVLPDVFTPFFWRVIYETDDGPVVHEWSINFLGNPREKEQTYEGASPRLVQNFSRISKACEVYFDFAVLPVVKPLRPENAPNNILEGGDLKMYHDLRFGSGLAFVRKLMALRPNADMPFILMTETIPDPDNEVELKQIRLKFSDSGRDSHWHKPVAPVKPDLWQWLVGLH